jgi:hypothetical protein
MKQFTAIAVVLMMGSAAHAAPVEKLELKSANLTKSGNSELSELVLSFQDKEPVSGACDLSLSRFEYVDAIKTLIVNFKPAGFCQREDYGKREGIVKWQLPGHLFQSANLKLIVNDRAMSELKIAKGQIIVKTKP